MNIITLPNAKTLERQTLKQDIHIFNHVGYKSIRFKNSNSYTTIHENPGDCGCLLLCHVFDINKQIQNMIEIFMNENGYSKIIGTIIIHKNEIEDNTALLKRVKSLGYTCIKTGKSPRHPEEDGMSYLIYKVIEPETTGYPI